MDRLQLYINISYDGLITSINPDEAVRQHVCDLSGAIENISYDPEQKNIFYLLKYTDQGCFIVVLRTIPDNMGDHLAAWIFVPYNIVIDDDRIISVVERVKDTVLNSKVTQKALDGLRAVFADTYEVDRMPGAVVANQGDTHAHRFYGGDTDCSLIDLIGSKRYQTGYLPYADVILADRALGVRISGPNLTHSPLYEMVKIYPPRLDEGPYRPQIFGHPFNRPFLAPLMGTVEIVWVSDTLVDIHRSVMIGQANMRIDNVNANHQEPAHTQPQTQSSIEDKSADHPDDAAAKSVDYVSTPDKVTVQQTEKPSDKQPEKPSDKQSVEAPDSQSDSDKANKSTQPLSAAPAVRISGNDGATDPRHPSARYYKFEIPASSAAISGMIEFDVHTHASIDGSPIDGYVCDTEVVDGNRVNYLRYAPKVTRQTQLTWGGIGLIAGVLLTLLGVWICGGGADAGAEASLNDSIQVENQTTQPGAENAPDGAPAQEQNIDRSLAGAVNYLDTNKKWTRAELEAYPDLKGLYDDMNHFRRERLYGHWAEKLKESRAFAKIAEHARAGKNKRPRVKAGQTTFNTGRDETINTRSYLNTIDP